MFSILGLMGVPRMATQAGGAAVAGTADPAASATLSGTVVDAFGAVITRARVQIRNADGTLEGTTQSNRDGAFTISGLRAGHYRLVVSDPDLASKGIAVAIGATGPPGHRRRCASLWLWVQ